jgi:ORF6N domain
MICLQAFNSTVTSDRKIATIESAIYLIRGQRVVLDSDLAAIYHVTTKRLNQQVKRNRGRFPEDFAFQLTAEDVENLRLQIVTSSLRSQSATSKRRGGRRYLPWAFTEHGALMLASVLNSAIAVQASVRVVRAFVRLREMVAANAQLAAKLRELERRFDSHDEAIANLFATLKQLVDPPEAPKRREIGFHVREEAARYGMRKGKIKSRNSRIS